MGWAIEWEPASKEWLLSLPENLKKWCAESFQEAIDWELDAVVIAMRAVAPSFEGDLRSSINRITGKVLSSIGPRHANTIANGAVGLKPDKTIVNANDVVTAPTPFSYGRAKHDGAREHVVALYNPRGGKLSKNRAKLVRQLKSYGGKWARLPDNPTKATFGNHKNDQDFPPPFVTVNPEKTKVDYITGFGTMTLLDNVADRGFKSLAGKWSA